MDKTVFRVYPDGEVIALFPQIAASVVDIGLCESYTHTGQHSSAAIDLVIQETRLATPKEYAELLAELEQIGFNPKPAKKCTYKDFKIRKAQVMGWLNIGE